MAEEGIYAESKKVVVIEMKANKSNIESDTGKSEKKINADRGDFQALPQIAKL